MDTKITQIAHTLLSVWDEGIVLSHEALFFLESTYDITTKEELTCVLNQEDFQDLETIIELIFFPNQSTRLAVEPLLNEQGLTDTQVSQITDFLASKNENIELQFPQSDTPICLKISENQLEQFMSRLFITRGIDPDINGALKTHHSNFVALSCRIFLRCKNIKFNEMKTRFAVRFIEKADRWKKEFIKLFEIFINLLSEAPSPANLDFYFLKRRNQEKDLLKSIQRFEEKRDRYSMEYLMMSKYQVPHDSMETVAERLRNLDTIINDILCIPSHGEDHFEPPVYIFPSGMPGGKTT